MSEHRNSTYQIRLPVVLCIGLAVGVLIGRNLGNSGTSGNVGDDLQKFREVLTQIDDEYVDEVNTSDLVEGSIQNMLTRLDPHSTYIPAKDKIEANEDLQGNFDGIGVEFNIFQDTIVVVTPLSGGPSEAVGIISGD